MSTLTTHTTTNRDSHSEGLCKFNTTSKAIEVSDGTNWLVYDYDTVIYPSVTSTRSLDFDGSNDYVSFSSTLGLSGTSACTIGGWIKCDNLSQNQHVTGANTNVLSLEYWSTNVLYVEMGGGNFGTLSSLNTYVTQGDWHHVMFTYDGSGSTNADKLKVYIDGSYVAFSSISGTIPTTVPSITNWYLGKGNYNAYFNGQLDEFAVWNSTALSASEISALYGSGALGTGVINDLDNAVGDPTSWWRFEETSGTTASDYFSNNDGTINGATPGNTSVP
jgi:archaellum component FlaF (FlaF/FlaG flagellin family)